MRIYMTDTIYIAIFMVYLMISSSVILYLNSNLFPICSILRIFTIGSSVTLSSDFSWCLQNQYYFGTCQLLPETAYERYKAKYLVLHENPI